MRKALVTLSIGSKFKKVSQASSESREAYAKKIGAETRLITEFQVSRDNPHYGKHYLADLLKDYDRILYVDSDILIAPDAPDIFQVVPEDSIGLFNEGRFWVERNQAKAAFVQKTIAQVDEPTRNWLVQQSYYNTGVMVLSKEHAPIFQRLKECPRVNNFFEQTTLNWLIALQNSKIHSLSYRFNRMLWVSQLSGESKFDCFFLHYAGSNPDELPKVMEADWKTIKETVGQYKRKNVVLYLAGGLGDQVASEPIIRFAFKNFYSKDRFLVFTHYPELFENYPIPEIEFRKYGEAVKNDGFFIMHAYPQSSTISMGGMSRLVSPNLVHPIDYAGMNALGRTLIDEERRIFLNYEKLPEKLPVVLVHAGRSWPSKTFPKEFWRMVLETIIDEGRVPVLVGREGEANGVVPLEDVAKELGVTSLVDKLSLKEFVHQVGNCQAVISNDSGIVHVAGGTQTPTGIISTVKEAAHVMPYGSVYRNLSRGKLERTTEPSMLDEIFLDQCTAEELQAILPTHTEIRRFLRDFIPQGESR